MADRPTVHTTFVPTISIPTRLKDEYGFIDLCEKDPEKEIGFSVTVQSGFLIGLYNTPHNLLVDPKRKTIHTLQQRLTLPPGLKIEIKQVDGRDAEVNISKCGNLIASTSRKLIESRPTFLTLIAVNGERTY